MPRSSERSGFIVAAALLLVLQLPLLLDPGYLSFDELQWWARADAPFGALPWVAWTDLSTFQYRPLTFNLWLIFAHAFAANAFAMHALFVVLGTINALLLAACLRALDVRPAVALAAAVAFVLSPYAAYTHGWTATLADLLVLSCALLGTRLLFARAATVPTATVLAAAGLATLVLTALLAKESAIVLPALWFGVAAWRIGERRAFVIVAPAVLVVLAYLALRLPVLWSAGGADDAYAWHIANVPARLAEYALYPWLPPLFEISSILDKSLARLLLAALCCAGVVAALWRAHWRFAAAWMIAMIIALGPVLLLGHSYDHYAYLASAAGIGIVAFAWSAMARVARAAVLGAALIASAHGVLVMMRMREVGTIERRFHADLVEQLRHTAQPLAIEPERAADAWMLGRWVTQVPRYRGVELSSRVVLGPAPAGRIALTMQPDGTLVPRP